MEKTDHAQHSHDDGADHEVHEKKSDDDDFGDVDDHENADLFEEAKEGDEIESLLNPNEVDHMDGDLYDDDNQSAIVPMDFDQVCSTLFKCGI